MDPECAVASAADAGDIAALVNRAYRPEPAMGGWTHEAGWVRGPRTTEAQVRALMDGTSAVLVQYDAGAVIACVHVDLQGAAASIGMLATDPALQGIGLGKRMLLAAERHVAQWRGATTLLIEVLDQRRELVAFYERRGYQPTGVVRDYPAGGGFGAPLVPGLRVLQMAKPVPG